MGVLSAKPNVAKGSVVLSSQETVPNGNLLITRTLKGVPSEVRSGNFDVVTGGFVVEDPEAPFGQPLTYTVVDTVDGSTRTIQTNRCLNPKAGVDTNNWLAGPSRTLTRETATALVPPRDAVTSLAIGANTAGSASAQYADRRIASCQPSGFGPGTYFISGQVYYSSPDLWNWTDVKTQGTWANLKATKGSWAQVRSSSSLTAQQAFTSLFAAVLDPNLSTTELRRNLVTTPSFEGGSAGTWAAWAGTGGAASLAVQTGSSIAVGLGTHYLRQTWTTAMTNTGAGGGPFFASMPVVAATAYTGSLWVRCNKGQTLHAQIDWKNSAGSTISSNYGSDVVLTAGNAQRISVTGTAPAGAVTATMSVNVTTAGTAMVVNDYLEVDGALFEAAGSLGTYFDGGSAAVGATVYSWTGTAYASASVAKVTDYAAWVPPFQILGAQVGLGGNWLTFSAVVTIPAGAPANCRLAFMHGSSQREFAVSWHLSTIMVCLNSEMASGGGLPYFDGDSVLPANPAANMLPGTDWVDNSGDASMAWTGTANNSPSVFSGPSKVAASTNLTLSAPTSLPAKAPILLSDPVAPQLALWFELQKFGTLTYPARLNQYDVLSKSYRIAVSQVRGKPTGQMTLMTYTDSDAEVAEVLFASGRILLFRNPDPRYQEPYLYLAIGDTAKDPLADGAENQPQRLWTVPFTVVERPTGLIEASTVVTWAMAKSGYVNWLDIFSARTNWLDAALVAPGA